MVILILANYKFTEYFMTTSTRVKHERLQEQKQIERNTKTVNYLVPKEFNDDLQLASFNAVDRLMRTKLGAAVDCYPSWHPLVWTRHSQRDPDVTLDTKFSGQPLDHTRYFQNGFITCPYQEKDAQEIIDFVASNPTDPRIDCSLAAEHITFPLYHEDAHPIMVYCEWGDEDSREPTPLLPDFRLDARTSLGLCLTDEIQCWTWSTRAEQWTAMRPYFLGASDGDDSMFMTRHAAESLEEIWRALVDSGIFGLPKPLRSRKAP